MRDVWPPRIDIHEQNKSVISRDRETKGEGQPTIVLVTTTGAKFGKEHTTPMCVQVDGDRLVVVGSMGGVPGRG